MIFWTESNCFCIRVCMWHKIYSHSIRRTKIHFYETLYSVRFWHKLRLNMFGCISPNNSRCYVIFFPIFVTDVSCCLWNSFILFSTLDLRIAKLVSTWISVVEYRSIMSVTLSRYQIWTLFHYIAFVPLNWKKNRQLKRQITRKSLPHLPKLSVPPMSQLSQD